MAPLLPVTLLDGVTASDRRVLSFCDHTLFGPDAVAHRQTMRTELSRCGCGSEQVQDQRGESFLVLDR
jgi:hypothetical protein